MGGIDFHTIRQAIRVRILLGRAGEVRIDFCTIRQTIGIRIFIGGAAQ